MREMQQLMQQLQNELPNNAAYDQVVEEILNHDGVQTFLSEHQEQVTPSMIKASLSKLNEFVRVMDAMAKGKSQSFAPQLTLNNGRIDIVYAMTSEAIAKQQEAKRAILLDNRMMSQDVKKAQLNMLDIQSPSRQRAIGDIKQFIKTYLSTPEQAYGLYLTGQFGVGKTYILGALANYLVSKNYAVTMLHYPTFVSDMKNSISQGNTHDNLSRVKYVDILMIDDIGAETNSIWVRDELLAVILETRMKENLPTFFTSNYSMAELEKHLANTRESCDVLQAKRLMERIRFLAKEVVLEGENRRPHR